MTKRMLIAAVVAAALTWGVAPPPGLAQQVVGQNVIRIPGIGVVDLDKLPREARDNIRIPGRAHPERAEQYGDLPARKRPGRDLPPPSAAGARKVVTGPVRAPRPPADPAARRAWDEAVGRMDPGQESTRMEALRRQHPELDTRDRKVPEDAYLKALQYRRGTLPSRAGR